MGATKSSDLIRTAGFEPMRIGGVEQSSRLEVGGDLHDLVVGPAARLPDRWGLIALPPLPVHLFGQDFAQRVLTALAIAPVGLHQHGNRRSFS